MKWIAVKIIFVAEDNVLATELISDAFYDCGLKGVVVEEPAESLPEDWGKEALSHERYAVVGYFKKDEAFKNHFKVIEERIKQFEKEQTCQCQIVCSEIKENDWSESWKDFFWPNKIGDRVVVRPAWREYDECEDDIVIHIDPGMAFGTGTHPTTCLCITLIEKYLRAEDSFLDVGAGSGILMIAAAKLGARKVCGTDDDSVAIDITRKNLRLNMVPLADADIINCHLATEVTGRFDIIAANLSREPALNLLSDAGRLLNDAGVLILSGITEDDKNIIVKKLDFLGFDIIEAVTKEDWMAVVCRLKRS
jgi:ribosomal protein L11 methyltransferase